MRHSFPHAMNSSWLRRPLVWHLFSLTHSLNFFFLFLVLPVFSAVTYEPNILCEVLRRGRVPPILVSGHHLIVDMVQGDYLGDYEMRCTLGFGGMEEVDREVELDWEQHVEDSAESHNGPSMLVGINRVDGNYKRRSFTHRTKLTSSIIYTCRIRPETVGNFIGREPPRQCSIHFVAKE